LIIAGTSRRWANTHSVLGRHFQSMGGKDQPGTGQMKAVGDQQQPVPALGGHDRRRLARVVDGVARPVFHMNPIRRDAGGDGQGAHDMGFGDGMADRAAAHQQVVHHSCPRQGHGMGDAAGQSGRGGAVVHDLGAQHDGALELDIHRCFLICLPRSIAMESEHAAPP